MYGYDDNGTFKCQIYTIKFISLYFYYFLFHSDSLTTSFFLSLFSHLFLSLHLNPFFIYSHPPVLVYFTLKMSLTIKTLSAIAVSLPSEEKTFPSLHGNQQTATWRLSRP